MTFQAIATQHGVTETTIRRMLKAAGVEPRPRGVPARELPVELILANHDAGMSAREIARKHGVGNHHRIATILRDHGRVPHHRGRTKGNRAVVLGSAVTNRQSYLRRSPPMVIPMRTAAERRLRRWTAAEREAVAQALRAGRVQHIHRGQSGLPQRSFAAWRAATYAFFLAMQRLRAAA